jgi:hypothetical protein
LYVFAFDTQAHQFLVSQQYKNMTVISLSDFEDADLLRVKPSRTLGEYCWTCSSSAILYSLERFGLPSCTYIDADMCFYSDPRVLIDEMGDTSVLITEHRYTKEYDQTSVSGKYCVQFITFKNDDLGMKVLRWWRNACIDWCFDRVEDGKFGDQKYLDGWTSQFNGVHELQNPGGGLAPWNMQQYDFSKKGDCIVGKERTSGREFAAVFFHFHGLKVFADQIVSLTGELYEMNRHALRLFYGPYVKELVAISAEIRTQTGNSFNPDGSATSSPVKPIGFLSLLRLYHDDARTSLRNLDGKRTRERLSHHHYFLVQDLIAEARFGVI